MWCSRRLAQGSVHLEGGVPLDPGPDVRLRDGRGLSALHLYSIDDPGSHLRSSVEGSVRVRAPRLRLHAFAVDVSAVTDRDALRSESGGQGGRTSWSVDAAHQAQRSRMTPSPGQRLRVVKCAPQTVESLTRETMRALSVQVVVVFGMTSATLALPLLGNRVTTFVKSEHGSPIRLPDSSTRTLVTWS